MLYLSFPTKKKKKTARILGALLSAHRAIILLASRLTFIVDMLITSIYWFPFSHSRWEMALILPTVLLVTHIAAGIPAQRGGT